MGSLLLLLLPLLLGGKGSKAPTKGKKKGSFGKKAVMQWADMVRAEIARSHPEVPLPMALTIMHLESGGNLEATNCRAKRGDKWVHFSCKNRECRDKDGNKIPGAKPFAQGLYQFKVEYQDEYDIADPYNPNQIIRAGVRLISEKISRAKKKWGGNMRYAIAAYNQGSGYVDGQYPKFSPAMKAYLSEYDRIFPLYKDER